MRALATLFLSSMLVLAPVAPIAAETAAKTAKRNPIVWLFEDIGTILKGEADVEIKGSTTEQERDVAAPSGESALSATPAPEETVTKADPPTGNVISRFFKSLTELFTRPAATTEDVETVAIKDEPDPAPVAALEEQPAPTQGTDEATGTHRNPLVWLLSDLKRIFQPTLEIDDTRGGAKAPVAEPGPVAEQETADGTETEIPAEETAAAADPVRPEPDTAENVPEAKPVGVEDTPWNLASSETVFDPHRNVFSGNSSGTPSTAPVKPVTVTETVAAVKNEPPTPAIRKRPTPKPEKRNYASLGRDHKAVTPDEDDTNVLTRLFDNLLGPDGDAVDREVAAERQATEALGNKISSRIVPEEELDLGYTATEDAPAERSVEKIGEGPLQNIDLYMGHATAIGAQYAKDNFSAEDCIERPLHGSVFCLADLHWPAEIAEAFTADTAFTLPGEAVVRFENGTISRVYAVFPAPAFADVVKYMQHRFGPPGEREIVWMPVMEAPHLPNTTFRWKTISKDRSDTLVLEVRNYDDQRRSFADMEHGMVRMYRQGSRPIFKHISTVDLMLMQRKRVARAPVEVNAPPPQKP